ncbi:indole-3-glycerol phosphate synthase [Paraliobacillus quinghaiensis]|uniref:Indole-3-glycerol phosphate synthase n=1 Tax=Paraliobacillus quinghaiensis TaxID=470815 RepID=A0A917TQH7_9BACI|nr:indole-3-glycerol phosphate synthase TrpC [Paraliobacillus quinghaiensis]GGM33366.1 indole-3-glycerol phosphate synthase [Paraliobacillus quinghaiensis]
MSTILEEIIQEKEREVVILKQTYKTKGNLKQKRHVQSLYEMFMQSQYINIIAEIKRASPSKGMINPDVNPPEQGKQYQEHGAGAISVLTDYPFFKGTMDDLSAVREAVDLPVLNKDFIIDEIQINRAKDYGANVILLIAAALPKHRLQQLFTYAREQDLEVLFEVHNEAELKVAKEIGATIIGINNRDLKTFEVDLATTEKLAALIDTEKTLVISESGIKTTADVERIKQVGVRGILVGETMMRSRHLEKTFAELRIQL